MNLLHMVSGLAWTGAEIDVLICGPLYAPKYGGNTQKFQVDPQKF